MENTTLKFTDGQVIYFFLYGLWSFKWKIKAKLLLLTSHRHVGGAEV